MFYKESTVGTSSPVYIAIFAHQQLQFGANPSASETDGFAIILKMMNGVDLAPPTGRHGPESAVHPKLKALSDAVDAIESRFITTGHWEMPTALKVSAPGGQPAVFPANKSAQPAETAKLTGHAEASPFGKGGKTLVDKKVRNAMQVMGEKLTFRGGWDGEVCVRDGLREMASERCLRRFKGCEKRWPAHTIVCTLHLHMRLLPALRAKYPESFRCTAQSESTHSLLINQESLIELKGFDSGRESVVGESQW